MNEALASRLCLLRAVEDSDPAGELLTAAERQRAARAVRELEGEPALAARADTLLEILARRHPPLARLARTPGPWGLATLLGVIAAFAIGLAVNQLGGERAINLLSAPMLTLYAWNLIVYLAIGGALIAARARGERESLPELGWRGRTGAWLTSRLSGTLGSRELRRTTLITEAGGRYYADWLRRAAPLYRARGERLFHLGAAALMVGSILGMYVRGLGVEYKVRWESTFLEPGTVHGILRAIFAPVSWIPSQPFPGVEAVEAMRLVPADARLWIHYYALLGLVVVVVPRLVLVAEAHLRTRRLAASFPSPGDLTEQAGVAADLVQVVPFGYAPGGRALELLRSLLLDVFGNRARIAVAEKLDYGAEDLPGAPPEADACLVLFSLAQTPEQEVHGAFLDALGHALEARPAPPRKAVIVDGGGFRERLGGGPEADERAAERLRAWTRVARAAGWNTLGFDVQSSSAAARTWAGSLREALRESGPASTSR